MKLLKLLVFASILGSCSKKIEADAWNLEKSELISISDSEGLPHCGISYTLVAVQFKNQDSLSPIIYLPCVEQLDKPLPTIGAMCSANGKFENLNGCNSEGCLGGFYDGKLQRVADELVCDGETYIFDL